MSSKVQNLTAATALTSTDLVYSVINPGTTPLDRKITLGDLRDNLNQYTLYADPAAADMGTEINALYAALPATGGCIVIPGGTFSYSTPILFNTNQKYVSLRGDGSASTFLKYTPTSGNAIRYDCGDPTGHIAYEITGFTLMGKSSLLAAGGTNTNTSVGIYYGGTDATGGGGNGAVGINTHDMNVNGFGTNWEIGADAYMLAFNHCSNSGGNGGQAARGSLVHINAAANSGERNNFFDCTFTDPGNSDPDNAIYITNGGTASNNFVECSIDNAQIRVGSSNGTTNINFNHFENAGTTGIYGDYIVILGVSSDSSTHINLIGNEFANSSGVNTWTTIVSHGGALYAAGNHIDNYNGRTVTNFIMHDLNNGTSSDYVVRTSFQSGALTNIIGGSGGVAYSLATASTALYNVSNSYSIGLRAMASNTNEFFSGSTTTGTFDHDGNWVLGAGSSSAHTFNGRVGVGGASSSTTFMNLVAGTTAKSPMRLVQGVAPTSPVDGDIWREDNTDTGLKIRINGVTKTISVS